MHLHPLLAQQPLAGPLLGNDLLFAVEEKKNNLWCTSRFERHCHFPLSQPSLFAGWSPVCRSAWVCSVGRRQASPWSCGTLEQSMGSDFNGISGVMGGSGAEEMRRGEGEDGRREAQVGEGPRTHKDLTLVFCRREGKEGKKEILLGKKKRGFGEGKWNGFGGKVEAGETIVEASCRELLEESHLTAHQENLSKRGLLTFHVPSYPTVMRVHVFEVLTFEGTAMESEEMLPKWYGEGDLPFEMMWPDDSHWMPHFLAGKCFVGEFHFTDDNTISSYTLEETTSSHFS